jgi:hypothetical protein
MMPAKHFTGRKQAGGIVSVCEHTPFVRVGVNGLIVGLIYRIANVNLVPGFSPAVFLGREPEGDMFRFALSGSEVVIALSESNVAERVFMSA